jgi:hypothetical protein
MRNTRMCDGRIRTRNLLCRAYLPYHLTYIAIAIRSEILSF